MDRLSDELVRRLVGLTDIRTTTLCAQASQKWSQLLPRTIPVEGGQCDDRYAGSEPGAWLEESWAQELCIDGVNTGRGDFGRELYGVHMNILTHGQVGTLPNGKRDPLDTTMPQLWGMRPVTHSEMKVPHRVKRMELSVRMCDQGFGNRKGHFILQLLRGDKILCEDAQFTPIAEHVMTTHTRTLGREHELVSRAQPGDAYRLLVVIGLGGGHSLTVESFTLLIELDTNHLELGSAVSNDSFHELSRTQGSA